ncbi:response regulator transcription factor [Neolewinella lacunae]|uniref:Response regulator transcription factor n=1 Tax=Neolewinella lacunae TaxID=1517758 RepID=A0A923PJW2_9BACT|nr:response regulator transcription factor [Neolewinella lacunae]MBC6994041.1 response regulator transcription factor [Neolewinella lacunae]MDN3634712.1 response regulator transcription factor [Neolewinella lacunae]
MPLPKATPISILIAKQNQLLSDCLKELFVLNGYTVVGQTRWGARVASLVSLHQPNICILGADFQDMPVAEICAQVREAAPLTRIVIYAHRFGDQYVGTHQYQYGDGFIISDCTFEELLVCMETVAAGEPYTTPKVHELLNKSFHNLTLDTPPDLKLSDREKEILSLVADALTMPEISHQLNISVATVNNHCYNIRKKLDLSGRNALHQYAFTVKNSRILS